MRKLICALASLFAFALPAMAQLTFPTDYEYSFRAPAKFHKQAVVKMGFPNSAAAGGQSGFVDSTLFRMSAQTSSVTTGTTAVGLNVNPNTLVTTGHALRLRVSGHCASNANTKVVNLVWGSTTIALLNAAANNNDFFADVVIYRTGKNAQMISVSGYANGVLLNNLSTTSAQTETAANLLQVQVPASTTAGDVVLNNVSILGESG